MSKTLVIVESPSKCKKIEQYLGSDYKVLASYGHFTKLDSLDQIQFDTFEINYKVDNTKVLKTIKNEIKKSKSDEIYVFLGAGDITDWPYKVLDELNDN